MRDKLQKQFGELKNTLQTLSGIEKVGAILFFTIALLVPLPGTGPASIVMITVYIEWRKQR